MKTSTEPDADWFEASVGGVVLTRISGEQPWQTVTLDVPAGNQRINLSYRKDAGVAAGADAVWIDAVKILPAVPLSIAEAVDANFTGEIAAAVAAAEWLPLRAPALALEGGDVLVLRPVPATGPGAVSCDFR